MGHMQKLLSSSYVIKELRYPRKKYPRRSRYLLFPFERSLLPEITYRIGGRQQAPLDESFKRGLQNKVLLRDGLLGDLLCWQCLHVLSNREQVSQEQLKLLFFKGSALSCVEEKRALSRHAFEEGLPCPKKLCYTDCVCEESLSMTSVHEVPQPHHTKTRCIRGLKHFRPGLPSHLGNTKSHKPSCPLPAIAWFWGLCTPKSEQSCLSTVEKSDFLHQG